MSSTPYATAAASVAFYTILLRLCERRISSKRTANKLVSGLHSMCMTCAALLVLNMPWQMPARYVDNGTHHLAIDKSPTRRRQARTLLSRLDDSQNPSIMGQQGLANALTAWEFGYIVYDTCAMLAAAGPHEKASSAPRVGSTSFTRRFANVVRISPVFFAHHVALIAGLGWLQTYIAAGRERGMWIIVAMLLMNASNPVMHLRWWQKKRMGRTSIRADVSLAVIFALSRFGTVIWILAKYGSHHQLGPWESLRRQRLSCQLGTGSLTAANTLWWLGILRGIQTKVSHSGHATGGGMSMRRGI